MLIAAAIPADELTGVPELAALIATLVKDGLAGEVRLPPLDAESVAALARRALPATAALNTAAWLYARARGNALYTVAVLEELALDPDRRVVPVGVQERVRMALLELPATSRQVLDAAAVIGHSFPLRSILTLVPGVTAGDLDVLVRRGLIVETGGEDEAGYDFVHPLVQESIYGGLGAAHRRELHQALAGTLPSDRLSARASHAGLGAAPGDLATIELLRQAARKAEREEAHRDALVHLERALAIALADQEGLRRELFDEIAWQASAAGEHVAGIRALEELAPLVANDAEEAARTDVRLASFLSTGAGDLPRAEIHAERAVRLLSARTRSRTLAAALNELAWIRGEGGDLTAQVALSRRAADLAREASADEVLMHALGCLGHGLALIGRGEAMSVFEARPFYCFSAWHDWAVGHAQWLLGDSAGARSRFERAVSRLDSMGARAAADNVRPDLWQVRRALGDGAPAVRWAHPRGRRAAGSRSLCTSRPGACIRRTRGQSPGAAPSRPPAAVGRARRVEQRWRSRCRDVCEHRVQILTASAVALYAVVMRHGGREPEVSITVNNGLGLTRLLWGPGGSRGTRCRIG